MAYAHVDPTPLTPISAAATEFSFAASGVDCAQDDYIVVWLSNAATAGTISEKTTSAWTLTTLNVTSGHRMALAYLKVGASAPSDVIFQANSGLWQGAYAVYRDADTTTFNAGTITTADAGSTVSSTATGALTPSSDNAHVVYFAAWRNLNGIATPARFLSSEIVGEVLQTNDDGTTFQGIAIGTWQQTTAAATSKTLYVEKTAGAGSKVGSIVLAIKNKTSGKIGRHGIGGVTKAAWLGYYGNAHDGLTWGACDAATINGIAVATAHTTTVNEGDIGPVPYGTFTSIASNLNTTGNWVGRKATFAAPVDMSGKILSVEMFALNQLGLQYGAEGAIIKLTDGTNWVAFQLVSLMNWVAQKLYTQAIDLENATPYDDSGSAITWSAITAFELHTHRVGSSGSSRTVAYRNILLLSKSTLTGGNSAKPLEMTYLNKVLNGWGYVGLCDKQGPSISMKSDVQIGDGSMPTYFDSSATMLSCEGAYSALSQRAVNIPANKIDITIKASASDTIYDRASATSSALQQNYTIDAASSSSATYSFAGKTFVGVLPVDNVGLSWTSATFSGCGKISVAGGGDLTNCIISNTASTDAALAITANGSTLDGCTIDGTGAAYAVEFGTSVKEITITSSAITAGSTDKAHTLKTAATVAAGAFVTGDHYEIKTVGTTDFTLIGASANTIGVRFTATGAGSGTGDAYEAVKITISGTTSLAESDVTSAGAVVWVAAPQPTLYATVLANTRTVLWNRTTSAELDNTLVSGTSWSKTITSGASSGDVLDLYAFKEGYAEAVATIIYSGTDATFAIEQTVDPSIDYYRTTESITDYTTLLEFNFYAPDIYIQSNDSDGATSLKRLFIYYNGALTTEDGARYMRGGITFRSAFDVVINRSVVPVAVDNVSATLGLYFTDEATIRVTTDDGTSWIAPPSAPGSIRYAFGVAPGQIETGVSGLTGPESAQLMALPSANATANATITAAVDGTTTLAESIRLHNAILAGKVSGAGTGTETFRDLADTKDRVVVSTDADGNRLAVTKDVT